MIQRLHPAPGVWQLHLDRPAQRNALHSELVAALQAELRSAAAAAECRVVLLSAAGRVFCAGADLGEMRAAAEGDEARSQAQAEALAALFLALHDSPKPVIALVQGAALGGGAGLVAACDVALATPEARFGFPEVRLGLIPAVISPYVVAAIGARQARRWFLSGETMSAAQAREVGLVQEIVPAAELLPRALALAAAIALGGPQALAHCKDLLREVAGHAPGQMLAGLTTSFLARTRRGAEARERLDAWLARRRQGD